jgi:signal transduction histidine kinase
MKDHKRNRTRTGRLLAAGLAAVLLCLAGFAVWGAFSTNAASRRAMQMSALGTTYDDVQRSARLERTNEGAYLRNPARGTLARFEDASEEVVAKLRRAYSIGEAQDQALVRIALARQRGYLEIAERGFAEARARLAGPSARPTDAEVPVSPALARSARDFQSLARVVHLGASTRTQDAQSSLRSLRRSELLVLVATPIAFALGLALLGLFTAFLLRLIRQAKQAQRAEVVRLKDSAERLQALDDMKNAFLQAVSHELRTPLTSILGFALTLQNAERGDAELPREVRGDLVDRLASNAKRLEGLLSELLDLDRVARGLLEPRRQIADVASLVRDVVDGVEKGDRQVEMRTRPTVIAVDGPKVERIVENLVYNAIKYSGPESPIVVIVEPYQQGVLLAVEDGGPGVPDALKEAVFQPFRQGPNRSPHSPGTGIGLSLVVRFAELHGGRAWVQDRPGGGASFRVYLPDGPEDVDPAILASSGHVAVTVGEHRQRTPAGRR